MSKTKTWRFVQGPFSHGGGSARDNGWERGIEFELVAHDLDEVRLEVNGDVHFLTPDDCAALGNALLGVVVGEHKLPGLGSDTRMDRFAKARLRYLEKQDNE